MDFLTAPDDQTQINEPGSDKRLQAGQNPLKLTGTPLSVLAEAGSSVRFKFMPASATPPWDNNQNGPGLFEPFQRNRLEARSEFNWANANPVFGRDRFTTSSKRPQLKHLEVAMPGTIRPGLQHRFRPL